MSSKIGLDDLTPSAAIDAIKEGDSSVEVLGFVDEIQSDTNFYKSRYYRIVINNGQGKRVQIMSWNEQMSHLANITQLYTIVRAKNLSAAKPMHPIYNLGNIPYELLVKNDTKITTLGTLNDDRSVIQTTIGDSILRVGLKIRIEGYMKCLFDKKRKNNKKFYVASITDGYYQLDLKVMADVSGLKLRVGQAISVIGVMESESNMPPRLIVNKIEYIVPLKRNDLPLAYIFLGNRYPHFCK